MLNKFFDCPNCGSKKSAVRSSYYPQIVVHKCDGKTLLEVGKWENNQVVPIKVELPKTANPKQLRTRNFILEKVIDLATLMKHGDALNNGTKVQSNAKSYLDTGEIWIALSGNKTQYMIFIKDGTIPDEAHFSGYDIEPIPKREGEEIMRELIAAKLIQKNPFPHSYSV